MSSPVITAHTPGRFSASLAIDADDVGVRMARADDMGVQRSGGRRQIVGVATAPGQQGGILFPKYRRSYRRRHQQLPDGVLGLSTSSPRQPANSALKCAETLTSIPAASKGIHVS